MHRATQTQAAVTINAQCSPDPRCSDNAQINLHQCFSESSPLVFFSFQVSVTKCSETLLLLNAPQTPHSVMPLHGLIPSQTPHLVTQPLWGHTFTHPTFHPTDSHPHKPYILSYVVTLSQATWLITLLLWSHPHSVRGCGLVNTSKP